VRLGCPSAASTAPGARKRSSEDPPILSSVTVAKQPKLDDEESKACPA
jgi:hypothetical protein